MKLFLALIAVFFLALPAASLAADVRVSASLEPEVVAVGDQAMLVVTVEGKFRKTAKPELPALADLAVYESGTSQSMNFINGVVSSSLSFTYVIVPSREGTYTIAPIRFRLDDKVYEANAVTLQAVKEPAAASPPPAGERSGNARDPSGKAKPFLIGADVDRDTVFVSQQVTWTLSFSIDVRANLFQSPTFTPPEAEGFWMEELPPLRKYDEEIEGRRYLVNELKRAYFPTAPGEYAIGPSRITVTVDDAGFPSRDDFFGRSFRSFGFGKPVDLYTEERKITVLPLPAAGKPAGFSGIVGRNVKLYVVSGSKKYEYVLVPKEEGRQSLREIRLSYFDPIEKKYKQCATSPIEIAVNPGSGEPGREIIFAGGGSDIEVLANDINHIHPVPAAIAVGGGGLYRNGVYLALHAIPALAVVLCLGMERRRRRWKNDLPLMRASRALREAEKLLGTAGKQLAQGRPTDACAAVASALSGYLADKMDVSAAGLTSPGIEEYLANRKVPEELRRETRSIMDACDAARYAQASVGQAGAGDTLARSQRLLRTLEKEYLR
ncbi:MAG: protein BatD [Chitinivibrionia bacterium]|nr:protein BatD [Chitinivibrionia bacterium]